MGKQEKSKKQKQNEVQTRNNERKWEPKAGNTQRENVTGTKWQQNRRTNKEREEDKT